MPRMPLSDLLRPTLTYSDVQRPTATYADLLRPVMAYSYAAVHARTTFRSIPFNSVRRLNACPPHTSFPLIPLPSSPYLWQAAVAEALGLLQTVYSLQFYKSGLPQGAGGGSGSKVRAAASALIPLIIDMRQLTQQRIVHSLPPPAHWFGRRTRQSE